MNPKLIQLFRDALDLAVDERAQYLDAHCADLALRAQVDALLLAAEQTEVPLPDLSLAPEAFERPNLRLVDRSGEVVGSFRLLTPLGSGGMGAVWLAERTAGFNQQVAIKWLHAGLSESARQRFAKERETLAKLEHPGIARIVDGGSDGSADWFAMEYVPGLPLDAYIKQAQPTLTERLNIIIALCEAVGYAHQNLIVHRDLKPGNILVSAGGQPKLLDFGVAKILDDVNQTISRAPMTFAYAAPEQIRGDAITTATDVYALGVILFELLTGERPHKSIDNPGGAGGLSLLQAITDTDATAPSSVLNKASHTALSFRSAQLKGDLDTIVLKALSRDPIRRYGSAQALADDLSKFLRGLPIAARPDSLSYRVKKWLRRQPALAAVLVISIVSLLAMSGYSWHQANLANSAANAATIARNQAEASSMQAVQAARQTQAELDVQAALREHFTAVLIRATASGKPISAEQLLALSADMRLAANQSGSAIPMTPAAGRALRLTLASIAMLRQDDAQLKNMIQQLKPLMLGANMADQTQFAMLSAVLQSLLSNSLANQTATTPSASVASNVQVGSSSTMLVVQARLAVKLGQVDQALALIAQAAKSTETNEAGQPMVQAAVYANYAQLLFDDAKFAQMQPVLEIALARFKQAKISGTPVPLLHALPANAALMAGQMQRAVDLLTRVDVSTASPAERGVQRSSQAVALFWLGRAQEAQALIAEAANEICDALNTGAETCLRARWLNLEINLAAGDRQKSIAALKLLQNSSADPSMLPAYAQLIAPDAKQAKTELEALLLKWAASKSRGRERFVLMRRALSVMRFCQLTNQPKLAEQARFAAIALSQGLQIPADSVFLRGLGRD